MIYDHLYQIVFTEAEKKATPPDIMIARIGEIHAMLLRANNLSNGFRVILTAEEKYIPEAIKILPDTRIVITGPGKGNAPGVLTLGITDTLE